MRKVNGQNTPGNSAHFIPSDLRESEATKRMNHPSRGVENGVNKDAGLPVSNIPTKVEEEDDTVPLCYAVAGDFCSLLTCCNPSAADKKIVEIAEKSDFGSRAESSVYTVTERSDAEVSEMLNEDAFNTGTAEPKTSEIAVKPRKGRRSGQTRKSSQTKRRGFGFLRVFRKKSNKGGRKRKCEGDSSDVTPAVRITVEQKRREKSQKDVTLAGTQEATSSRTSANGIEESERSEESTQKEVEPSASCTPGLCAVSICLCAPGPTTKDQNEQSEEASPVLEHRENDPTHLDSPESFSVEFPQPFPMFREKSRSFPPPIGEKLMETTHAPPIKTVKSESDTKLQKDLRSDYQEIHVKPSTKQTPEVDIETLEPALSFASQTSSVLFQAHECFHTMIPSTRNSGLMQKKLYRKPRPKLADAKSSPRKTAASNASTAEAKGGFPSANDEQTPSLLDGKNRRRNFVRRKMALSKCKPSGRRDSTHNISSIPQKTFSSPSLVPTFTPSKIDAGALLVISSSDDSSQYTGHLDLSSFDSFTSAEASTVSGFTNNESRQLAPDQMCLVFGAMG